MEDFNYGKNLRNIRRSTDFSQIAVANELGISQSNYARLEKIAYMKDKDLSSRIANFYGVHPNILMPNHIYGTNLQQNTRHLLNTRFGMFLAFGVGLSLSIAAHDLTQAICFESNTSQYFMVTAKWTAFFLTAGYIFYWVRKTKRLQNF